MPELPEVEIVARNLARWVGAGPLASVRMCDPLVVRTHLSTRTRDGSPELAEALARGLHGATSLGLVRHGKRLGWRLHSASGQRISLLVHLGMTGNFGLRPEEPRFARMGVELAGGRWLWFMDPRRFGCLVPVRDLDRELRAGVGPDALLEPLDGDALRARCRGRRMIKVVLLDQSILAGIGNIQATEALFRAGIAPSRTCDSLSEAEWSLLVRAIPEQLRAAIEAEDGEEVHYLTDGGPNVFALYGRAGAPCPRCGTEIRTAKMQGRATYWCDSCQPSTGGA